MKTSFSRFFFNLFNLSALLISLTGSLISSSPALAAMSLSPTEKLLNRDGSLNLSTGYSGTLDSSNYSITLDPARGPLFKPAQTLTPGAWNALDTGLNAYVNAIAISGTDVYVGGNFTNAGGNANANYIAKWNGSTWSALGTGISSGSNVLVITISGTDVYVGGNFTNAGGDANADNIAKWNGTAWSALGTGLNSGVRDIVVSGADVYAGGMFYFFDSVSGTYSKCCFAKWNGSTWSSFDSSLFNGTIETLGISGTDVYVGGHFTNLGGDANADYIAKWDGTTWSALGATPLNQTVLTIAINGTDVYAGGYFTNAGGDANADYIATYNGTAWSALGTGLNTGVGVAAITISGTDVYAGGLFTDAGGDANADNIAKWDGATWSAVGNGLNSIVDDITISGTDVYAGGSFTDSVGNADNIAVFVSSIPLTVTANDFTITYGDNTPTFTFKDNPDITFSTDPICSVSGTHTDVNSYPIVCSGGVANGYIISYTPGTLTINQATPSVSVTNSPVIYNGSAQSATVESLVAGTISDVKYDGSSVAPTNVGVYAITADFMPTDTINYASLDDASAGNFVISDVITPITITLTSNDAQDGYILESAETSGKGGAMNTSATTINIGDDAMNKQYRGILSFDTSGIPDNAIITSVKLKFKYAGKSGKPFYSLGNLLVDVRKGSFSNNSAMQLRDFKTTASKNNFLFYTNTITGRWFSESFSAENFEYINLANVTQFRLHFTTDDNNNFGADYLNIHSGNSVSEANRPRLIIEYYVPTG